MREENGWWWPDGDTFTPGAVLGGVTHMPRYLAPVPTNRRGICVQAGGNTGVYARALASIFAQVYTFEADPDNFACLNRNLCSSRIVYRHAALLNHNNPVHTERIEAQKANFGASFVQEGGAVPSVRLDDLALPGLDYLMLDTEGTERLALEGGASTIMRHSPVIVIELNKLGERFGFSNEDTETYLCGFGYQAVAAVGRDKIFRRR